jgi:hypothetical protein
MNSAPATEYAIYLPDADSYMLDQELRVKLFPTESSARAIAKDRLGSSIRFEIHSRLNYAVTPWEPLRTSARHTGGAWIDRDGRERRGLEP